VERNQASEAHLFASDKFLEGNFIVTEGRVKSRPLSRVTAPPIPPMPSDPVTFFEVLAAPGAIGDVAEADDYA
jgi:hypothetical protein